MLKKLMLAFMILVPGSFIISQQKTVTSSTTAKPAPPQPILKNLRDSASYTAGIHIVNQYRMQGVYNLNAAIVARSVNDLQTKKPLLINSNDINKVISDYRNFLSANTKTTQKTLPPTVILKNLRDSASYAAGIYLVNFFRDFDIINLNSSILIRAINDMQNNKQRLLNDSLANMVALRYQQQNQLLKNKTNIDAGSKFLAENKKRKEVVTTKSGLQYEVIKMGDGPKPGPTDKVSCHYIGAFIDGKEFNNSYQMGTPISFSVDGVIKGWTEALQMMPVGSKWKLFIPYQLAYGPGDYQSIPGGSTLVFEIDLLGIVGK